MDVFPTRRLVTQNLIVSAVMAEQNHELLQWHHIEDLAALIDVYCLFEEAHALARSSNVLGWTGSPIAELMSSFIEVNYIAGSLVRPVAASAEAHFKTYIGLHAAADATIADGYPVSDDVVDSWSPDYPDDEDRAFGYVEYELYYQRSEIVRPSAFTFPRSFFGRSFLYLAYADVSGLPFTPDIRRAEILDRVLQPEERLGGELAAILRSQYADSGPQSFKDVRKRISPLAAVVLDRANGRRDMIATEMFRLRDELADLRKRLAAHENVMLFGSFADSQRAQRNWQSAFEELRRAFGPEPDVLNVRRALNFTEDLSEIVDEPTKTKSWVSALLALPVEAVARLMTQRPLIEIHRLRRSVPAGGRLQNAVAKLFDNLH